MYRSRNGVYERSQTEGVDFSAFIPNPLPPIPPLDMDQFHQGLEAAHLALGYLDAMIVRLPSIEPVLFSYVRREAIASSQIEGTQSTFEDLLTFELGGAPSTSLDDAAEVSNYVSALQHGISRLRDGFPISSRLIRGSRDSHAGRGAPTPHAWRVSSFPKLDRRIVASHRDVCATAARRCPRLHVATRAVHP